MFRRSTFQPSIPGLTTSRRKKSRVRFAIEAPGAMEVSVAGDFNQWDPEAALLQEKTNGRWETTLSLLPGRYEYKFMVDGQWRHDPTAVENVPNQFGSLNSVVEVKPTRLGL